ncbi:MAG: LON peptidase substrate-binding domain-containing protein [Pseudomonadota bacterium]
MTEPLTQSVPLFPLQTVLFPQGPLPLRLFEARYIDMIKRCMRHGTPFGVVAISEGREVGPSQIHDVGTLANIVDFYQGSDGLLGITAIGDQRFRLLSEQTADDGLRIGEVALVPDPPSEPLPEDMQHLAEILQDVLDDLGKLYEDLPRAFDDAHWVSHRFCEILPIPLAQRQHCLETDDANARLLLVAALLQQLRQ